MEREPETFDLESVYDEKIAPLMTQIIDICKEHKMPMMASFLYAQDGDDKDLCTTLLNHFDGRYSGHLQKAVGQLRSSGFALAMTITE